MGEGYGCSNIQCSTIANAIKLIHSCRRAAIVSCTSDKEAFLCIRLKQELPYKRSLDPKISTGRAAVLD